MFLESALSGDPFAGPFHNPLRVAPDAPWPFFDRLGRVPPLKRRAYGLIYADPPWKTILRSEKGYRKSPEAHYKTLSLEQLKAFPVRDLAAKNSMLVLWTTWNRMDQAIDLMQTWGFTYKTGGSWVKKTKLWKTSMGPGMILRSACEPYIIGTIGHPKVWVRDVRNVVETEEWVHTDDLTLIPSHLDALRREHSRKPEEMRRQLERMRPEPGCELWAREPWTGRDVWGDEVDFFKAAA